MRSAAIAYYELDVPRTKPDPVSDTISPQRHPSRPALSHPQLVEEDQQYWVELIVADALGDEV
jgi:hypothetical protein